MTPHFRRKLLIALNVLAIGVLAILFVQYGTSADNSARVRNSLIAELSDPGELSWRPEDVPESFLAEQMAPPRRFVEVIDSVLSESASASALDNALRLASHLVSNREYGQPIQSDAFSAYQQITGQGRGYCADYSQVFSALAISAGLDVREWGLGFSGFGVGHTFNEVFDGEFGKWIFLDTFHSMYVVDRNSNAPLSALEFQERLRSGDADSSVRVMPISEDRFVFRSQEHALSYYERGKDQFYLFWGNNVFSYDEHPLVRQLSALPRALEVTGAIVVGIQPTIRLNKTSTNDYHVALLEETRRKFLALFVSLIVACSVLLYQLWMYRRARVRNERLPG